MQKYFLFILTNLASFELCGANGTLSVNFKFFSHKEGRLDNGRCCDWPGYLCFLPSCDHLFRLCLDELNGSSTDMAQCGIGGYNTGATFDMSDITFGKAIGSTQNPKELKIRTWQGSMRVKVEVLDYDPPKYDDGISDVVEFLSTEVQMEASKSRAEQKWKEVSIQKRTTLNLEMAVFCDENWYGPKCDVYRKPSNSDNRHYKRTSDGQKRTSDGQKRTSDGQKQCLHGWDSLITNNFKAYPSQEVVSIRPFRSVTLRQMACIAECARTCGCTCVSVSSDNKCKMFDVQASDISRSPRPDSKVFVLFKA